MATKILIKVNSTWETLRIFMSNQFVSFLVKFKPEIYLSGRPADTNARCTTRTCSSKPLRPRHTRLVHKVSAASLRSVFKTLLVQCSLYDITTCWFPSTVNFVGKVKPKVKDGLFSFFGCLLTADRSVSEITGGGTFAWCRSFIETSLTYCLLNQFP